MLDDNSNELNELFRNLKISQWGFLILSITFLCLVYGLINWTGSISTTALQFLQDIIPEVIAALLAVLVALVGYRTFRSLEERKQVLALTKTIEKLEEKVEKSQDELQIALSEAIAELRTQIAITEFPGSQVESLEANLISEDFTDTLENKWTYRGSWKIHEDSQANFLAVANSEIGGYLRHCLQWTDYEFGFETKIVHKCSSWIIRAADQFNYVMLQCAPHALNPHFRDGYNNWLYAPTIMIDPALPLMKWFHVRILVRNARVAVSVMVDDREREIYDETLLQAPVWVIPEPSTEKKPGRALPKSYPHGAVGFRQSGDEVAYFRNVSVRRFGPRR